jgi:spore cortex biosynthesis protein YabQ
MILPVYIQIYYFLSTVIAGIAVGIMFDVYRIIVGFNNQSRILMAITDMLFWIFCSFAIFVFFLYTNNGDLRYYIFVGLLLGILLYFKLASKRFIIALRGIIYFISKIFRLIFIIIKYPIKRFTYLIKYILYKVGRFLRTKKDKTLKENTM